MVKVLNSYMKNLVMKILVSVINFMTTSTMVVVVVVVEGVLVL